MGKRHQKMICMKTGLHSKRFAPCLDCPNDKDTCENIVWAKGGEIAACRAAALSNDFKIARNEHGKIILQFSWGGHFYSMDKMICASRDGFRCLVCGDPAPLSLDHVVPVIMGGTDGSVNLQTLCHECNMLKWHEPCDYRFGDRFVGWRDIWHKTYSNKPQHHFIPMTKVESIEYHKKNRELRGKPATDKHPERP